MSATTDPKFHQGEDAIIKDSRLTVMVTGREWFEDTLCWVYAVRYPGSALGYLPESEMLEVHEAKFKPGTAVHVDLDYVGGRSCSSRSTSGLSVGATTACRPCTA